MKRGDTVKGDQKDHLIGIKKIQGDNFFASDGRVFTLHARTANETNTRLETTYLLPRDEGGFYYIGPGLKCLGSSGGTL